MATPLDVPKRPAWRYQTVRKAGMPIIPAQGMTELDRKITRKRTTKNDNDRPAN